MCVINMLPFASKIIYIKVIKDENKYVKKFSSNVYFLHINSYHCRNIIK